MTFMPAIRFAYRYRFRVLGWFLDEHVFLRELFARALPGAIRREIVLNERIVEIPYALRALDLPPGSRLLDVGSRWSALPFQLLSLGYRPVATDLDIFPIQGSGFDYVLADLRFPPFKPRSFDGATVISTLEHVGVGYYDSRQGSEDDLRTMGALREILRPGGLLILTVPFGRGEVGELQRAYDSDRLDRVVDGWDVEDRKFLVTAGGRWSEVREAEAAEIRSSVRTGAVALLSLRRP